MQITINYKKVIFLSVLLLLVSINAAAQVTIGGDKAPEKGALLELMANKGKGLLLPRVNLIAVSQLEPEGAVGPWNSTTHIGLWVYNMFDDTNDLCEGPYVWDGTKWNRLWGNCSGVDICEFPVIGSNTATYHVYCEDVLNVLHADALDGTSAMENIVGADTYTYHLMRVEEFIQIWEKNRQDTSTAAFLPNERFFVYVESEIDPAEGWITTAKKMPGGASAEITAYGTVAPNGIFTQVFPGGTPIGGEYTTATVRGVRN